MIKNFNCSNKYFLLNYFNEINIKNIYFNCSSIKYYYSFHFNLIKIEYKIGFYDKNNLLLPSNFSLLKRMNIICHLRIIGNNKYIYSLANINNNKFFQCTEFFKINEKTRFGIKIFLINEEKKKQFGYSLIYLIIIFSILYLSMLNISLYLKISKFQN